MRKTAVLFLLLAFALSASTTDYPEFIYGKKIVVEKKTETSVGLLKAYGIVTERNRYVLWELEEGGKVKASVLLKLNGDEIYLRVGKARATNALTVDLIVGKKVLKRYPWLADMITAAQEASVREALRSPAFMALYFFLTGENPFLQQKTSSMPTYASATARGRSTTISCDQCDKLHIECINWCSFYHNVCVNNCRQIQDPIERDRCLRDCSREQQECYRLCLDHWVKCHENCAQ